MKKKESTNSGIPRSLSFLNDYVHSFATRRSVARVVNCGSPRLRLWKPSGDMVPCAIKLMLVFVWIARMPTRFNGNGKLCRKEVAGREPMVSGDCGTQEVPITPI